jgi:hypothetical protein
MHTPDDFTAGVRYTFSFVRPLSASLRNLPCYCLYVLQARAVFVCISTPLVIARISRFTLIAAPVK